MNSASRDSKPRRSRKAARNFSDTRRPLEGEPEVGMMVMAIGKTFFSAAMLVCVLLLGPGGASAIGYHSIGPDDFPVFDDPEMLTVSEAEARGAVLARDAVIGVARDGEARAYPIIIMGIHELGNDRIAGVPIAITW